MARVLLKPRKARPFWFGHPWVFSGAVQRVKGQVRDGDLVTLCDDEGRDIGRGFFNARSQIRVRMLALDDEQDDPRAILAARLARAMDHRLERLRLPEQATAYRLVHAEGDGLPGLVVDVIGSWLVVQLGCLGLEPFLPELVRLLQERTGARGVIERVPAGVAEEEGLDREPGVLAGEAPDGPVSVTEAGTTYLCDPVRGQKTGFFCDQRENRIALAPRARGREVLDAFCYVGGFGLRMAREGADSVHMVDSSAPALEMARQGAAANGVQDRVSLEKANVLRALDAYRREGRTFDVVVVDPPKLVRRARDLRRGLRLYAEINRKALAVLRPEGLLVTCSCSQHVTPADLDGVLGEAAKETGRRLQEVWRGGQGPDHPVLLPLSESRYLDVRALLAW